MDPNKQQPQTGQTQVQSQSIPQQGASVQHSPIPQQQPVQPVSVPVGAGKEGAPASEVQAPPVVQPTETVPVLHPEVEKAGVEVVKQHEQPHLPQDVHQVVQQQPVVQQPDVLTPAPQAGALPLTAVQATTAVKKKKWRESVTWLAVFVLRQLKILEHPKEK